MKTSYRSAPIGTFRADAAGTAVRVAGWVHRRRDLGGLIFFDVRDRSGRLQLSLDPRRTPADVLQRAKRVAGEWVIAATGTLQKRPPEAVNPELPTGEVELHVESLDVLSEAETPPIPVALAPGDELPAEELRLRYRYLDLRRVELLRNLSARHHLLQAVRRSLSSQGFLEIETPMLTRRTPEGARDYLVPSRIHAGEFYALPQSPQLYKQLLMVAGYDRYFQIARCLRDEDLRADRQPEFTQIDAELSFVDEDDVFAIAETMLVHVWREILDADLEVPFPRLTYREAMERYGTDKPDLRFDLSFRDLTAVLQDADFRLFQATRESADRIRGFVAPGGAALSRRELDELTTLAKSAGAAGALWCRRTEEGMAGPFARALDAGVADRFIQATGVAIGDLVVLIIGRFRGFRPDHEPGPTVDGALDALRRHLADRLGLRRENQHAWAWVTEFPLFDWDAEAQRLVAMHHPFTAPHAGDVPTLLEATADVLTAETGARLYAAGLRSRAYDAVYNGNELASGSIRIHNRELQRAVFRALGIGEPEADAKFGFLLEAFRYGVPPHGGFAFGFDRLAMLLVGGTSLRDVIAFPKSTQARALFEGAPSA
ncbi:MAG: aspartate--tRNA ligase, partial [Gemmatimonadetes bacterium]|nr:aspartate--tRNA ligase [Gemmatimonadota bacterium]